MQMIPISDLIFLAETNENTIMAEWLRKLEKMIKETPNSYELGEKIIKEIL